MHRSWVLTLAFLLVASFSCGRASEERDGDAWFVAFTDGAFLARDPWLDVRQLFRERRAEEKAGETWHVPYARWLKVVDGWGGPEDWGAWALGERTTLDVFVTEVRPYELVIDAKAPPGKRGQTVAVFVNGVDAGSFAVGDEWERYRHPLPLEALRRGWNDFELAYGYHLDGTLANDDRPLALGIERLGLLPPDRETVGASGPGFRVYRGQETLVLEMPGDYVVPLDLPADASALEFELEATRGAMELGASVVTVNGREDPLASLSSSEAPRLDLSAYRGSRAILVLSAAPQPGERFTLRRPALVRSAAGNGTQPRRAAGKAPELPHVAIIVLDAARADHVGVYGYERDTTPHVDRLAAESLVFENAVAECSYTLCSMPSLLSGLTYPEHGMVSPKRVLKDEVTTLAEVLHDAGYLTLGYTGNPNNSRVTGTEQGFDELHEIWKTHPRHITRRVLDRLRRGVGDRPLFLMLHYVPPHEPYAPDPEFDVFGDPDYGGPVTSDRKFTRSVYAGEITLDDADMAEMVALYDGNLKMADAAVGEVLQGLKEAGLYDDALVIVTSDHGEAFGEHGEVGHNSTIYEEMLRVPLIVKLPAGWEERAAGADTRRLVTLADVPAAILRVAGIDPPATMRGFDFVADGDTAPASVIFLRSAQLTDPFLGVRTLRYKALTRGGGPAELYDLAADPDERSNAFGDHPVIHTGLSLMLARAIREPHPLRAGARAGEISEKDRQMLRTLGYL